MKHTGYRADIDGLRAIAVMSVVLFHLKIPAFSGGYVGVDIFFVISGYLITRNILADGPDFSFSDFYTRRARRILPALIATVLATYVLGFLWLSPEFFRQLAKESTHALLSIANIQYWLEAKQYFAPTADQLALLHFWSLSLEEQFYLFWPIFIVLAGRTNSLFLIIVVGGIVSFGIAVLYLAKDDQAVFFLMPFRVFEFAIGALVIALERQVPLGHVRQLILLWGGLVAIAISVAVFGPLQSYAGVIALLPCLGAAAVILAHSNAWILTNRPVLAVGVISYSLYLCHWPVIVFVHLVFGEAAASLPGVLLSVVAMFAIGTCMYLFIEQPGRRTAATKRKTAIAFTVIVICAATVTHGTFLNDGLNWRLSKEKMARTHLLSFGMQPCLNIPERRCAFGDLEAPLGVELIGDSYVEQYVGALHPLLQRLHIRGETSTEGGCLMLFGLHLSSATAERCQAARDREFAKVHQSSSLVMIGQAWTGYSADTGIADDGHNDADNPHKALRAGLVRTIEYLSKPGRKFLIIGAQVKFIDCRFDRMRMLPGPLSREPPSECIPLRQEQAKRDGDSINQMVKSVQRQFPETVQILIPAEAFCDDVCPIVAAGLWLYQDDGHFTLAGAQFMGRRANDTLLSFLSTER